MTVKSPSRDSLKSESFTLFFDGDGSARGKPSQSGRLRSSRTIRPSSVVTVTGDTKLEWDEDTKAVPGKVLEEFRGNPPSAQCIFKPAKSPISLSRPGDETHPILADGGYQIVTLFEAGVLREMSPPCKQGLPPDP